MKKEPIRNEFRSILSAMKACVMLRDEKRKQDRNDAGIIDQHEHQKNKTTPAKEK